MRTLFLILLISVLCMDALAQFTPALTNAPSTQIFVRSNTIVQGNITNSLTHWYKFDDGTGTTAIDSGSTPISMSLNATPSWITGQVGPFALSFTHSVTSLALSQWGSAATGNIISNQSFSISAWAKFGSQTSANNFPGIFGRTDNTSVRGFALFENSSPSSGSQQVVWGLNDGTTTINIFSRVGVDDNNWHHYVGVCDRQRGKSFIYQDGILISTSALGSLGSVANVNLTGLNVARRDDGVSGNNTLTGSVDDPRLFMRALTSIDVWWLYIYRP